MEHSEEDELKSEIINELNNKNNLLSIIKYKNSKKFLYDFKINITVLIIIIL